MFSLKLKPKVKKAGPLVARFVCSELNSQIEIVQRLHKMFKTLHNISVTCKPVFHIYTYAHEYKSTRPIIHHKNIYKTTHQQMNKIKGMHETSANSN